MVFKRCRQAEKTWKRIKGYRLIAKVIEGVRFVDGEGQTRPYRLRNGGNIRMRPTVSSTTIHNY